MVWLFLNVLLALLFSLFTLSVSLTAFYTKDEHFHTPFFTGPLDMYLLLLAGLGVLFVV